VSRAGRITAAAILALFALQWLWHGWLAPPRTVSPWLLAAVFALPALPAVLLVARRNPRAAFWGAVAALLYFCHGVMLVWSEPAVRGLALAEIALATVVVVGASWDGMRARFRRRPPATPGL
jgi:uncharacterized membrane protein